MVRELTVAESIEVQLLDDPDAAPAVLLSPTVTLTAPACFHLKVACITLEGENYPLLVIIGLQVKVYTIHIQVSPPLQLHNSRSL